MYREILFAPLTGMLVCKTRSDSELSPAAPKKPRRVGKKKRYCPKVSGTVRNGTLGRRRLVPLTILVLGSTC